MTGFFNQHWYFDVSISMWRDVCARVCVWRTHMWGLWICLCTYTVVSSSTTCLWKQGSVLQPWNKLRIMHFTAGTAVTDFLAQYWVCVNCQALSQGEDAITTEEEMLGRGGAEMAGGSPPAAPQGPGGQKLVNLPESSQTWFEAKALLHWTLLHSPSPSPSPLTLPPHPTTSQGGQMEKVEQQFLWPLITPGPAQMEGFCSMYYRRVALAGEKK